MRECLAERFFMFDVVSCCDEGSFIATVKENFEDVLLISLFHDIVTRSSPSGAWPEPGPGFEILDLLGHWEASFALILHSTDNRNNLPAYEALKAKGWRVELQSPVKRLDQVRTEWFPLARKWILETAAAPARDQTKKAATELDIPG